MKKFLLCCLIIASIGIFCAVKANLPITVINDNGLYVINIPEGTLLEPYVAQGLATNKKVFTDNNFILSMNAGYFDTVNKQTTSYVTINGEEVLDPTDNKNLINNPKLQIGMDRILNRSELRYLSCPDGKKYDVERHFAGVDKGCTIINAIQAGPQLLPEMTLEDEFFIAKNEKGEIIRDPIGVNRKVARIAIGIFEDNTISIFVATNKRPMSLQDLANYMRDKGVKEAINFDGGGSVSLNYDEIDVFSDKNNTRRPVKSFWVVKNN